MHVSIKLVDMYIRSYKHLLDHPQEGFITKKYRHSDNATV